MVTAQLLISLGGAEEVGSKFCASHMVKDMLPFFESFTLGDIFGLETSIEAHITIVLEDGVFHWRFYTGLVRCIGERLIMADEFATDSQTLLVFSQLLKVFGEFLLPGFDSKI